MKVRNLGRKSLRKSSQSWIRSVLSSVKDDE